MYAATSGDLSISTGACLGVVACPDADGDGFDDASCGGTDCDDNDEDVNPDATEVCDGQDNDCDGDVDEGFGGPVITNITVPVDPLELGNPTNVSGSYTDECDLGDHTATWDWGDGGPTSAGTVDQGLNTVIGSHTYDEPGVYIVTLEVEDVAGNNDIITATTYAVVYDPDGGFVTGGGWIQSPPGAYTPDETLTGKANFGFVSKYKKGATVPAGNTTFNFNAADFKFKSTEYEWLVIAGPNAKFKGSGEINNQGDYEFMLTGVDGQVNGGGGTDKFRIKISDAGGVIYDNKMGSDEAGYDTQELGGGSITIHANSKKSMEQLVDLPKPGSTILTNSIEVFPNPSRDFVDIKFNGLATNLDLRIYDRLGRIIY